MFKKKQFLFKNGRQIKEATIILNIWKRKYLKEQLEALSCQTVVPKEIWIIHYENHFKIKKIVEKFRKKFPSVTLIESSKNLKFFGRFSIAINVVTKYVWVLDDDIIPGKMWLENCIEACESLKSIISCSGRIIPKNEFQPEHSRNLPLNCFIGDVHSHFEDITFCKEHTKVDFGCQSYFFKSEWLSAFWSIWPVTFLSGEDIHLSATCKSVLGIGTTVLKQIDFETSGSIKKKYGIDQFATFKQNDFLELREKVIRNHIEKNKWKPINW